MILHPKLTSKFKTKKNRFHFIFVTASNKLQYFHRYPLLLSQVETVHSSYFTFFNYRNCFSFERHCIIGEMYYIVL